MEAVEGVSVYLLLPLAEKLPTGKADERPGPPRKRLGYLRLNPLQKNSVVLSILLERRRASRQDKQS